MGEDDENPEKWYFFKDDSGFEVKIGYNKQGVLFNHAEMVKTLLNAFEKDVTANYSFLIAGQPVIVKGNKTKYWEILINE